MLLIKICLQAIIYFLWGVSWRLVKLKNKIALISGFFTKFSVGELEKRGILLCWEFYQKPLMKNLFASFVKILQKHFLKFLSYWI